MITPIWSNREHIDKRAIYWPQQVLTKAVDNKGALNKVKKLNYQKKI